MKSKVRTIREDVKNIEIKKRGTSEGNAQREGFRLRWGMKSEEV